MADLLDDLRAGEAAKAGVLPCPLCDYIQDQGDLATRDALARAAAGTIGINSLAAILRDHGSGVGRRTIERHRREDHRP